MDNEILYNVFGTLGAVCWSVQLIPQIIINYRRHSTEGLQRSMMLLWALAGVPLGVYNIVNNFNIALKIQPQILTSLSLCTWGQCWYYGEKWPKRKCLAAIISMGALLAGIEVGLVFALRAGLERNVHWPVVLMGVLSALLLALGVLRHYYDVYVHRTVRGISFIFVGIDALGDVFSLISVFFQPSLDILGMVIYATEFVLWCGIFACGGYFNLIPWMRARLRERSSVHYAANNARHEGSGAERDYELSGVDGATGGNTSMARMGSSTSVFRTPSSVMSVRHSVYSESGSH